MEVYNKDHFINLFAYKPELFLEHLDLVDFNYQIIILPNHIVKQLTFKSMLECGTTYITIYKSNIFVNYNGCNIPLILRKLYTHKLFEDDLTITLIDNINNCYTKNKLVAHMELCADVIELIVYFYSEALIIHY